MAGLASCALVLASSANAQIIPDQLPPPVRGMELTNNLGKFVPLHLQFTDSEGRIVSLGDYFNRPVAGESAKKNKGAKKPIVIQMSYFRCPILCPTVLQKFTATINDLDFTVGEDFDVLIVSFDHRDTPSEARDRKMIQLMSYDRATTNEVRDGWHYVVSSPENARALGDALGFPFRYLPESEEYSHGTTLFVLTPEGKISSYLNGLNYPVKDVRLALLSASDGKIGSFWDAFPLWCYHFDPNAGSFTLQAMRLMRVGGAATVILIGGLLFAMHRFEVRRRTRALAGVNPSTDSSSNAPSLTGSLS